jgi:hypothetical protein
VSSYVGSSVEKIWISILLGVRVGTSDIFKNFDVDSRVGIWVVIDEGLIVGKIDGC